MKKEIAETCNCSGLFAKISLFLLLILTMFFPVHAIIPGMQGILRQQNAIFSRRASPP